MLNNLNLKNGYTLCNMENQAISNLNSDLALNKINQIFSNTKHFQAFILNNFERLCKLSFSYNF